MRVTLAVAAAVVVALLAAGCGGGSGANAVAHLASTTTTTGKPSVRDPMAQAIAYAACMRRHGVPDFPDPRTSGTGSTMLSVPDTPKGKSAESICRRLISGFGTPSAREQAQRLASLLKFATCMRAHGVTDFPDPDNQGEFPKTGGFNRSSPVFQAAQKTCLPLAGGFVKRRDG